MKRSIVVCAALIFICGLVFLGCTKKSEGKLVYWTMWNEAEPQGQVIGRAAEAFTKETGIKIDINFNGRDIRKTLQPALDAGEVIDMFDEDVDRVNGAWGTYLLPLDSYVAKSYPTTGGSPYSQAISQA
ncbi:MAG: ABC transporter substrate-binding protein, partial [Treponema sp.]|nr:ABC transporter substrate-binding protein [Treponema sp.]